MQKQQYVWMNAAAFMCLCFVAASIFLLTQMTKQYVNEDMRYLDNAAKQNETALTKQIEGDLQTLHAVSVFIGERQQYLPLGELTDLIGKINESNPFIRMGIASTTGKLELMELGGKYYSGIDVSEQGFFKRAMLGKDTISNTTEDPFNAGSYINYYSVPIKNRQGQIIGVLCAINDASVIRKIIDAPLLNGTGFSDLYDSSGEMILRSARTPINTRNEFLLDELPNMSEATRLAVNKAFDDRKTIHFSYTDNDLKMMAVLQPLEINDWFILSSIPQSTLRQRYIDIIAVAVISIITACTLFWLLLLRQKRQKAQNQKVIETMAYVDELTGGRTYNKFLLDVKKEIVVNSQFAIWCCDLKKFRFYNDDLGYAAGNQLLQHMHDIFSSSMQENGVFGRHSADNFIGLIHYKNQEDLENWFEGILEKFYQQESAMVLRSYIEIALGFYCHHKGAELLSVNEMVTRAGMAQKASKNEQGSNYSFFSAELGQALQLEAQLESEGKLALEEGQFKLYFQPQYAIQEGDVISGAEVLCRWEHPEKGLLAPGKFIPLFEKNGFIVDLDRYIFRQVCAWVKNIPLEASKPLKLAVNVSRAGLLREDFVEFYTRVKQEFAVPDGIIELEITESMGMNGEEMFVELVTDLRKAGFICALDDFGAGYSSLNLLKNLPVDVIKLDMLFFKRGIDKEREQIVLRHVISMIKELEISIVAEGVEDNSVLEFLRSEGCDTVQGYIFSKAIEQKEFEKLIE